MTIVLAGLPLKLRARIAGQLPQASVLAISDPEALKERMADPEVMALVLHHSLAGHSLLDTLAQIRSRFHGLLLLILHDPHSALELQTMVRSEQVQQIFYEPAPVDEVVKQLALELGLRVRSEEPGRPGALDQVWQESLPAVREWMARLEEALAPTSCDLAEARRAAHYLAGNLGSFGFPQGTLLAREAEQLLDQAMESSTRLNRDRLERVLEALWQANRKQGPQPSLFPKVVVVCDSGAYLEQLDLEARLLQWQLEVCDDLSDLPRKLDQDQARVVLVDSQSAAARRDPKALEELLADPFPTVALASPEGTLPPSSSSCRWLQHSVSPYVTMLAVLRTQLTPSLDNPPCILVVDDDRISLKVVEHSLTQVDFHVESLECPLAFWDRLEKVNPDLVILDIELPNISGIELCRAMRLDDRYARLPVMFLSSYADSRSVRKAFEAGADDYLYKPIYPDDLRTRVSNRLQRSQLRSTLPRPLMPVGRAYSSLDQLLLRSLRESVPLGLALASFQGSDRAWALTIQRLRSNLRGEDLVKPMSEDREILIAMLTADSQGLLRRLATCLGSDCPFGVAWFPEEGHDLDCLLEKARERSRSSANKEFDSFSSNSF